MKLIYIAAPYRAETIAKLQHNIAQAKIMAQYYWLQGNAVICPHLNTANFDGLVDDKQFLNAYKKILLTCDEMIVHPDWVKSEGSIEEMNLCTLTDMPFIILTEKKFKSIKRFVEKKLSKKGV